MLRRTIRDQPLGAMRMMPGCFVRVVARRGVMMMTCHALQPRRGRYGGDRGQQAASDYKKKLLHILSPTARLSYFTAIPRRQSQC
jgi:hypothetical protein